MVEIKPLAPKINEPEGNDLICYCFQYTKKDIESDFLDHGRRSMILERIALEKKLGRCQCEEKNPKGS